jgi:hypothetical protein
MHDAGKGDKRRPTDNHAFDSNFDSIFGEKKSVRGSFIWDSARGEMVPKDEYYANQPVSSSATILNDIQPYKAVATGEIITSRSHHREYLKRNNLVELGNERIKAKEIPDVPGRREAIVDSLRKHKVKGFY